MGHAGCRGIRADPEDRTGDGFYEGAVAARGAVLNETPAVESIESRASLLLAGPAVAPPAAGLLLGGRRLFFLLLSSSLWCRFLWEV